MYTHTSSSYSLSKCIILFKACVYWRWWQEYLDKWGHKLNKSQCQFRKIYGFFSDNNYKSSNIMTSKWIEWIHQFAYIHIITKKVCLHGFISAVYIIRIDEGLWRSTAFCPDQEDNSFWCTSKHLLSIELIILAFTMFTITDTNDTCSSIKRRRIYILFGVFLCAWEQSCDRQIVLYEMCRK